MSNNQKQQSQHLSRDIKFRAWNKEKKVMVYDNEDESAHYFDGVYGTDLGIINNRLEDFFDRYDYMQYIGLKDKNGKEVYEGDIVYNELRDANASVERDSKLLTYKGVVYDDGIRCEDIFFIDSDSKKVKLVGNIYENPYLLKTV